MDPDPARRVVVACIGRAGDAPPQQLVDRLADGVGQRIALQPLRAMGDRLHGPLAQDPGRPARRITLDAPARRIRGRGVDAGRGERGR